MDLIHQNPFRVLGLPVTSTDKEIAKRIGEISLYAEMGKPMEYDVDHYFSTKPIRSEESVKEAKQSIEQPFNKLFHSLFWFWEGVKNTADEMAFSELKRGNVDKALRFWEKEVKKGVNSKNKSNRQNLATLLLGLAQEGGVLNKEYYFNSLSISGEFLASGDLEKFSNQVLGAKHNVELTETVNHYVDEMVSITNQYLGKRKSKHKVTVKEALDNFSSYPDSIRSDIERKFIGENIYNIEKQTEIANDNRNKDATKSNKTGFELFENTKEDIKKLNLVLSKSNLKYQLIADKLAEEILQCGVSYFNEFYESEIEAGDEALKLAYYAKEIAIGNDPIDKINENIDIFKSYIKDKPKRKKLKPVQNDFNYIYDKIREFDSQTKGSEFAKTTRRFIERCKPRLNSIKKKLGAEDEDYLDLSDLVVGCALNYCIDMLNAFGKYVDQNFGSNSFQRDSLLATTVNEVEPVFDLIGKMDMSSTRRTSYSKACQTLGLTARRGPSKKRTTSATPSTRVSTTTKSSEDDTTAAWVVVAFVVFIIFMVGGGC